MKRDYLNAVKKLVDPPMLADTAYQNDITDLSPGEIVFVSMNGSSGGRPVVPALDIKPDMNALLAGINDARQAIRESYFVDLFMMVSNAQDRDKTAREIAELHEEKLSVLGPVLERLSKEQHSPSIEACVHYCRAAGLLPEPPEDIEGESLKIEYTSIFAQAQKMSGRAPLEQFISFTGGLMGSDPSLIDVINMDAAVRRYADLLSIPADVLRSHDEVEAIRESRAAQEEQARQMAEMQQSVQSLEQAAQGAKLMSETETGGGSLLEMVGGGF